MLKNRTVLAHQYQGEAVLTQTFSFESREEPILDLVGMIEAEGYSKNEAGVHALAALPNPDPHLVEFLTCGALTLDPAGALTGDPAVMVWLAGVRETGRAW